MKKVVIEISTSEAMKLSIACSFTATAETISKADKTDLLRLSKKNRGRSCECDVLREGDEMSKTGDSFRELLELIDSFPKKRPLQGY